MSCLTTDQPAQGVVLISDVQQATADYKAKAERVQTRLGYLLARAELERTVDRAPGLRTAMKTHWRTTMRFTMLAIRGVVLITTCGAVVWGQDAEPFKFFRQYVGLQEDQIAAVRSGKAIAKVLDSRTPDEVFVFGSVYVQSTPERYLKFASDVDALRKLPSYLAIQKFSDPPEPSDLDGFTLETEDIKQLKNCGPGKCEVQLPTEAIDAFHQSVNWSPLTWQIR